MASVSAPNSSLRSVASLTVLSLAQLLVQFGTQLVLARLFGAGSEMDAFLAALAVPIVVATILAGSLAYVMVPLYAERVAAGRPEEAQAFAGQIGIYVLAGSLLATIAVAIAAHPFVAILCPGFSPTEQALTAELLRIVSGLIVANSLIAYLNALYHCRGRFVWPAVAGVIGPLAMLAYIVVWHHQQGIVSVAWGTVAGAAVTTALLAPQFSQPLRQALYHSFWPQIATWRAGTLLLPLLVGSLLWRLDPLVDRWLGSYLPAGSIAHLGYAWRLASGLMMIGTSGLSVVAFPAIAAHAAAGRRAELNGEIAHALRLLVFLLVPMVIGLALFAESVVRLLFERGKFTAADSEAVATLLVLYLGVVVGATASDLLSRTLYALHDTRTPVIVSSLVFLLALVLKFALAGPWGAAGLAALTSAYYLLNMAVLAAILLARLGHGMLAGVLGSLLRTATCAGLACLAAWLVGNLWKPFATLPAAIGGSVSYVLAAWVAGDEFAHRLFEFLRRSR